MSEKFNLKDYKKINGDDHIERRLRDEHKKEIDVVEENQLEKDRVKEPKTIIENQLEKVRKASDTALTESRLERNDTVHGLVKHRNPEAYEGDINKVEEQRLSGDRQEDEKYELVSETPDKFKWWKKESPDGLKIAKKINVIKVAQPMPVDDGELEFGRDRWQDVGQFWKETEDDPVEQKEEDQFTPEQGFDIVNPMGQFKGDASEKSEISGSVAGIEMMKAPKIILTEDISAIMLSYDYDDAIFEGDPDLVKKAVLKEISNAFPELIGFVSPDDIQVRYDVAVVRAVGDELRGTLEKIQERLAGDEGGGDMLDTSAFSETAYVEKDLAPEGSANPEDYPILASGEIKVNLPVDEDSRETIIRDVIEFINGQHNGLNLTEESIDDSRLETEQVIAFQKQIGGKTNAEESTEPEIKRVDWTKDVEAKSFPVFMVEGSSVKTLGVESQEFNPLKKK